MRSRRGLGKSYLEECFAICRFICRKSDITFADQTWTTGNSAEEHLAPAPDDSYYQAVFNNVDIPLQTMQWLGLSISEWKFEGVGKTFEYTFMEEN